MVGAFKSKADRKFFELATVGMLDVEEAYGKVFKPKDRKSLTTALARKQKRHPALFEKIRAYKESVFESAREAQKKVVIDLATKNAITPIEKREINRRIMMREATFEEYVVVGKEVKVIHRKPNPKEILKAIDLDNRMVGIYQIDKRQSDKENLFMQLMIETSQRKRKDIPNHIPTKDQAPADSKNNLSENKN